MTGHPERGDHDRRGERHERGDRYERRLSPIERLWLVADRMRPPFANQMVLEGDGALDEAAWRTAVAAAAAANPGSRAVWRGVLGGSRWVDAGEPPRVRAVDGGAWDGRGPEGAPFLATPLPPREGPTCEVLLVDGAPPRVVFRTHHAVMDGRGTMTFAEDVFRALRGDPLVGTGGPLAAADDLAFARALDGGAEPPRAEDCLAPTGRAEGDEPGVRWRRVTLPTGDGPPPRRLLPRVAVALAALARRHGEGRVRFDVPVDMRARRPDARSTANLTGMVHVEVGPDDDPEAVQRVLLRLLAARREAALDPALPALRGVSVGFMTWIGRRGVGRVHGKGRYMATGVLSNLGRLPLDRYRGGGFRARVGFFVPPGSDSTPFFLTLAGHDAGVELTATAPRVLATNDRLEETIAALVDQLRRDPAARPG